MSISLDVDGNCQKCSVEPLNQWKKSSDFPIINPTYSGQKTTCIYAATSLGTRRALPHFPFDTVVKLNVLTKSVQTWSVGTRKFIGEPIFVPKGVEEDDGYLLVIEVRNQLIDLSLGFQYCLDSVVFCSMQFQYRGAILLFWTPKRLEKLMH